MVVERCRVSDCVGFVVADSQIMGYSVFTGGSRSAGYADSFLGNVAVAPVTGFLFDGQAYVRGETTVGIGLKMVVYSVDPNSPYTATLVDVSDAVTVTSDMLDSWVIFTFHSYATLTATDLYAFGVVNSAGDLYVGAVSSVSSYTVGSVDYDSPAAPSYVNNENMVGVNCYVTILSASNYHTVTFDSSCWTNGDVFYGINPLGELNNNLMGVPVNASVDSVLLQSGTVLSVYGVADAGYYFAGWSDTVDGSHSSSGQSITVSADTTVSVTFSAWTEEFDNECFVAFSVDNSYTTLNVLFNGQVYTLGNGGSLFWNFSVPYNTRVTFGYWNNYYTFSSWSGSFGYYNDGVLTSEPIGSSDNPDDTDIYYTDADNRAVNIYVYPISVYSGVATPTPVSPTATVSTDVVTPFFSSVVPVLVPLALLLVPAFLIMVFVRRSILAFVAGLTAGAVVGYVALPVYMPLYAVVAVLLVDVAVVYGVSKGAM